MPSYPEEPAIVRRKNYFEDASFHRLFVPHPDHAGPRKIEAGTFRVSAVKWPADMLKTLGLDPGQFQASVKKGAEIEQGTELAQIRLSDGKTFSIRQAPPKLAALAKLYGLDVLLLRSAETAAPNPS